MDGVIQRLVVILTCLPLAVALSIAQTGFFPIAPTSTNKLWYTQTPSTSPLPPLVVCHGGPGVPSDYLFPLVGIGRSVVFWDQLGCGRSSSPKKEEAEGDYSVDGMVRHLSMLLETLGISEYHMLGQSWGGILAFEHALASKTKPLSLTLSNTPTSVSLVENEATKLINQVGVEDFETWHNCKISPRPQPLVDAYAHAGTIWRGTSVISDWEMGSKKLRDEDLPVLCVRGENDFVTKVCVEGWSRVGKNVRAEEMEGCGHHCLLENEEAYLRMLNEFIQKYDP